MASETIGRDPILDLNKVKPEMRALLVDLQAVLNAHNATLAGAFAIHLMSDPAEEDHKDLDRGSLFDVSALTSEEVEMWG